MGWVFSLKKVARPWRWGIAGLVGVGAITAGVLSITQPHSATDDIGQQTIPVEVKDWTIELQASGVVRPIRRINLGPEEGGKIAQLFVKEGDFVKQGQVIAQMVSDRLQVQLTQYRAQVAKAEAELAEKRAGSRPEEIAEGRAKLQQAQAELTQVLESSPAELSQAEFQLQSAQVKTAQAKRQRDRFRKLEQVGAVSQERWEEVNTDYKTTQFNQLGAQKRLNQAQVVRTQDTARRRAAALEQEQALRRLQNGSRPEEMAQAVAAVQQAKAELAQYQVQLKNTIIRAPFAGIITRRFAQAGEFVTPTTAASAGEGATSTSIVELSSGLEVEAKVPEASIPKIQVGQSVEIRTDASSNQVFRGRVQLITPRAIQENNITTFRVKVAIASGQNILKPEMNVRLTLRSQPLKNARLIPLATVMNPESGKNAVYIVGKNNQPELRLIILGTTSGDRVQVLAGLSSSDRVFTSPPATQKIEGVDTVQMSY
jgi:HlyD family secretion protein